MLTGKLWGDTRNFLTSSQRKTTTPRAVSYSKRSVTPRHKAANSNGVLVNVIREHVDSLMGKYQANRCSVLHRPRELHQLNMA